MRSLVDKDAAAFTAPGGTPVAGVVIGLLAVPGRDEPVGTAELAHLAGLYQIMDLDIQRIGSLVEHHTEGQLRMRVRAGIHRFDLLDVNAGGLIGERVHTVLQREDDNVRMEVMRERCNDSIHITGEDHFLIILIYRNVRENLFCQFSLGGIYVADRRKDHIRNLRTGRSSGTVGTGTYGYAGDETCVIRSLVTESYDTHSDYICHSNSPLLLCILETEKNQKSGRMDWTRGLSPRPGCSC